MCLRVTRPGGRWRHHLLDSKCELLAVPKVTPKVGSCAFRALGRERLGAEGCAGLQRTLPACRHLLVSLP